VLNEAISWATPYAVDQKFFQVEAGDLTLAIHKLRFEWQLHYSWSQQDHHEAFSCRFLDSHPEKFDHFDRIAMESSCSELLLMPTLADRPVVVRSYAPLIIPRKSRITLYVSTPLWIGIHIENHVQKEFPVQQLSETWMGLLTGEGELCYGSHTHARLDKTLLLNLPYRALTPVTIKNKCKENLKLERLSIPAAYLSLFEGETQLHTEPLTIVMEPESQRGVVQIGKVDGQKALALPREKAERGILESTWENLFA